MWFLNTILQHKLSFSPNYIIHIPFIRLKRVPSGSFFPPAQIRPPSLTRLMSGKIDVANSNIQFLPYMSKE